MRGTPVCCMYNIGTYGIIPAHAGNTKKQEVCKLFKRDHPRACGEHQKTRGLQAFKRDHPRACGEHRVRANLGQPVAGSSPRMRGTPVPIRHVQIGGGIIPAHAGNTKSATTAARPKRDHPRACGEHLPSNGWPWSMRGIIPAHAGNTRLTPRPSPASRDHPRACGEHSGAYAAGRWRHGSSPRMRGTPLFIGFPLLVDGIIPAHAGNTDLARGLRAVDWDHPRACGEHR